MGTLEQGQLSCKHGDSSGGRQNTARVQKCNVRTAAKEVFLVP